MKPIKAFNEFVREGIIKKQTPDRSRAEFLIEESEINYNVFLEILKKIKITDKNANSMIKLMYDILMGVIRAKMLLDGYNATGQGAHEAEISYLRVLGFSENEVQFADQLRYYRNGMLYYGTILDREYAENVLEFLNRIYPVLRKMAK
jgi:hypothetical protein